MLWMLSDMPPLTSDKNIIPMIHTMRSKQKAILM